MRETGDGCYVLFGSTSNAEGSDAYLIKACDSGSLSVSSPSADSGDRKLEGIIDIMGREVNPAPYQILFYVYDDGSVEQKFMWD